MSANFVRPSRILRAAGAYFGIVFGAGFLFGLLRVLLVVPAIGERHAELAEMPFMFVAILLATNFVRRRFAELRSRRQWAAVGLVALALLLAAELLLALALAGGDLTGRFASRDPVSGSAYLAMLLVFAAIPCLTLRAGAPTRAGERP